MSVYAYIGLGYLIIINIISLITYIAEAEKPSTRISALLLILLPIAGGAFGAALANYFKDTEFKELRSWLSKFIAFLPPIMFIIQVIAITSTFGLDTCISFVWDLVYSTAGVIGCILIVINVISFILIIIRKSAYYIAPHGNFLIPDLILIPILVLGGATGGLLAKILFNFKEDWSCNATKELQNFIYNGGMFLFSAIHIGLCIFFFC